MGITPVDNPHQPGNIAVVVVFGALATILVIFRFIARHRTRTGYELDDWMALTALLFYLAALGGNIWGSVSGDSVNPEEVPLENIENFLLSALVITTLSLFSVTAAKLSVLHFYKRIFSPDKKFLLAIHIMAGICIAWLIAGVLAVIFQCTPIERAWKPFLPGTCIDFSRFVIGIEVPNAFIDFVIVAMPISVIRSMHLQLRFKIAIAAIFFLGAIVGITGLVRIAVVYKPGQIDLLLLGTLTSLQLLLAIFCACLPALRPLLPKNSAMFNALHGFGTSLRSLAGNVSRRFGRTSSTSMGSEIENSQKSTRHTRKYGKSLSDDNISMVGLSHKQDASVSEVSATSDMETNRPDAGKIMVNREFEVSHGR